MCILLAVFYSSVQLQWEIMFQSIIIIIIISSLQMYRRFLTSFLCVSTPLCPQLPVWVLQSHHRLPNHVALKFFSLLLVYLSFCLNKFMQKCVVFQNMDNPSMFPLPNGIQYLTLFSKGNIDGLGMFRNTTDFCPFWGHSMPKNMNIGSNFFKL